jgi:ketosteroid isomerase-like protein
LNNLVAHGEENNIPRRRRSNRRNDPHVKLLDSVWADTFVDTDEQGGIATKQEQLAKVAASKTQIKSLDVDQQRVDWYGDMAVVTERFKVTYVLDGKEHTETGRATDVWVKQHGEWKCVAAHASTVR